jgi:ferrous iron transport protein A
MCGALLNAEAQIEACRSCPLYGWTQGCRLGLLRCPACGYHSLPHETRDLSEPAIVLKDHPRRGPQKDETMCLLSEAPSGTRARLMSLDGLSERELKRLLAYGLAPGVSVQVLQRVPAVVIKVQEIELALEEALAQAIYVVPEEPPKDVHDETAS